jgi:SulP family sulfate permease
LRGESPTPPLTTAFRARPAILGALRDYSAGVFRSDLIAGVTVGFVALPLALAFGIASGVSPQAGIITAIVGGTLVALLGGSRTQIAGPTGAFVVIVSGIVVKHGMSGLLMVTLMAGLILFVLGLTGLGSAVKFIPRPIVVGFTNGIALLIVSTQIKDFFGLRFSGNATEFFARMQGIARHAGGFDEVTTLLSVGSLIVAIVIPRIFPRVPGAVAALLAATLSVRLLHLHVETIGSRFGAVAVGLPQVSWPHLDASLIIPLLPSACTVALLAAVESLLSAVVADSLTGDRHDSNVELMATGVANVVVPFFGGIPVTGAIARTATNIRSGARTPVSGVVHAATLLAIVALAAPLASTVPLAALAAILVVVAYNMGEWREIASIVRLDNAARSVWFVTFFLTVVADLTLAVGIGMSLAALLYIYRVSQTTTVSLVSAEDLEDGKAHVLSDKVVPSYVSIVRIHGPFLFGTTETLVEDTADLSRYAPIVILRLRHMTAIDETGLHALETFRVRLERSGRTLLLCGARAQPADLIARTKFVQSIGPGNILPNVSAALERARDVHASFDGLGEVVAVDALAQRL